MINNRLSIKSQHIFTAEMNNRRNQLRTIKIYGHERNEEQSTTDRQPGSNPEVRTTEGGKKLVRINLATNETYTNSQGEKITDTQWHNIIAWGKTADVVEKYLTKGIEVMIEGKLVNRTYNDKEGNKRYVTEVQANDLLILSKK